MEKCLALVFDGLFGRKGTKRFLRQDIPSQDFELYFFEDFFYSWSHVLMVVLI